MDEQQIQSVTRIRYIAHECLRDHGSTSALPIDNSENEVVKKIRGKERVRRRGTSKRRRKDDPEEFYASSMHIQLYQVPNDVDHEQLCLPTIADHTFSPTQRIDGVREYAATNEVEVEEVDEDQLSHGSEENPCGPMPIASVGVGVVQQPSLGTSEDVTLQNDFTVTA